MPASRPDPNGLAERMWRVRGDPANQQRGGDGVSVATDEALAAAVRHGDDAALEQLYRRYGGACFGLASRIVRDTRLAEDVVQEVFLTLWRGAEHDTGRGSVATWLLTITHHRAVDLVRRESSHSTRRASAEKLTGLISQDPSPEDRAWASLRGTRVRQALAALRVEHREVLLLAYYGGYSQSEIASMTGLPLGTVKSRTLSGMQALRGQLAATVDDRSREEGQ